MLQGVELTPARLLSPRSSTGGGVIKSSTSSLKEYLDSPWFSSPKRLKMKKFSPEMSCCLASGTSSFVASISCISSSKVLFCSDGTSASDVSHFVSLPLMAFPFSVAPTSACIFCPSLKTSAVGASTLSSGVGAFTLLSSACASTSSTVAPSVEISVTPSAVSSVALPGESSVVLSTVSSVAPSAVFSVALPALSLVASSVLRSVFLESSLFSMLPAPSGVHFSLAGDFRISSPSGGGVLGSSSSLMCGKRSAVAIDSKNCLSSLTL